jgi:hypothetical protein
MFLFWIITVHAQGNVRAQFEWSLLPRFHLSYTAYNHDDYSYRPSYVYPSSWAIDFNACASSGGGNRIRSYTWTIEGIGGISFQETMSVRECASDHSQWVNVPPWCLDPNNTECLDSFLTREAPEPVPPALPAQGDYRVTLGIQTEDGRSDTQTQTVTVEDLLVVSIGDSNASGEGNPDQAAEWNFQPNPIDPIDIEAPTWWDDRCHRSLISGPALAAYEIERADPHTSVTFLSFACSGAKITRGLVDWYRGIDPPDDNSLLLPQVAAVAEALCSTPQGVCTTPNDRQSMR